MRKRKTARPQGYLIPMIPYLRLPILIALLSFGPLTNAAIITFEYQINSFIAVFEGVAGPTGPMTLTVVSDTTNPDLFPGDPNAGYFAATTTITAPTLGLLDATIAPSFIRLRPAASPSITDVLTSYPTSGLGPPASFRFSGGTTPGLINDPLTFDVNTPFFSPFFSGAFQTTFGSALVTSQGTFDVGQNIGGGITGSFTVTTVPEPSTYALFAICCAATLVMRRRVAKQARR